MKVLGITRKKRREFCEIIKNEKEDDIVYDESGIKNTLRNGYAWFPRRESVHDETKGRTTEKLNIVVGLSRGEIIAPMTYECAMDSEIFNFWLEYQLLPDIPKNFLVVMDNASFHKSEKTKELVDCFFCRLIPLI